MSADHTDVAFRTSERLRTVLRVHFGGYPPDVLATALVYELTSVIAAATTTEADAIDLITAWTDIAVHQIRTFGVGHAHP